MFFNADMIFLVIGGLLVIWGAYRLLKKVREK